MIRPYHSLVNRVNKVRFKVKKKSLLYTLRLEVLVLLSIEYPELKAALAKAIRRERI